MNIGIFSGSFNPIHIGHVILGNYITEFTDIEEVWFLVTPQNPLKADITLLDENQRLKMVNLALEGFDKLKASDFEFHLPRPSYTVNTFQCLSQQYPEHSFSLIIGADNWVRFPLWKDYQTLLDKYPIYIYPRLHATVTIPDNMKHTIKYINAPVVEISSTFIRDCIRDGKDIKAFLNEDVYHYIQEKHLYNS